MDTLVSLLFFVNIAWLATHELDAILHHEWRFFPFLAGFDDTTAYRIFTLLHIPLFVWIFSNSQVIGFWVMFDLFLIIHAALHGVLRNHPKLIGFKNRFSMLLTLGGAPLGLVHLMLIVIHTTRGA